MISTDMNVYLDNNATTRPLDSVVEAIEEALRIAYANPSSVHAPGRKVRGYVEQARETIAALIDAKVPSEIIFTSGGTESISQAIFVGMAAQTAKTPTLIVSSVEHAAVLEAAEFHGARGVHVEVVGVDANGQLDIAGLRRILEVAPKGSMVSIMLANNETGVIFPIPVISELCRAHGAYLHVDAVQAAGKLPIRVRELGCDYLSLSAHKFHGPKGVGALFIRQGAPRQALLKGHQESGARGGTENVPGIIGMGVAAQAALNDLTGDTQRMRDLRGRMEAGILSAIPGAQVNGDTDNRLCNTSNILFLGKDSARMVEQLSARGVYVSAGAACTTGGNPSHVLRAMGLDDKRANAALRFSLSKLSTEADVESSIAAVKQVFASSLDVYKVN